jgi:dihydrofolate reductase
MRKIIYAQIVSLDGYIEGPNGDLNWSVPGEELHQHFNNLYLSGEIDTSIYGRRLYENMAGFWPTVDENSPLPEVEKEFARLWRQIPKLVYSNTLEASGWNSIIVKEIIPEEIQRLKQQKGNNIEIGGANLAASFIDLGLVDEFWMYIHPTVLGGGKPYFPEGQKLSLEFIDSMKFPCQVVRLRYKISK